MDIIDEISLTGLRAYGKHGVFEHERREGQEFIVDLMLAVSTSAAAQSDSLADTVDYGALAEQVTSIVEGEPVNLIETLAARIADAVLIQPRVQSVSVVVHKPSAPIAVPFQDVAVKIRRERTQP